MTSLTSPWQQPDVIQHSQRLLSSFRRWTARSLLISDASPPAIAQALFEAPFVVVSHGIQADPIFNYGNQQALNLWELEWEPFIHMPSRLTAEPVEQQECDRLLAQAKAQGYISDYKGIRISSSGRRFWIQDVFIWDVLDEQNQRCGQAALFHQWDFIDE